MELLNAVTPYKLKKNIFDWTMSSPIVIHGDKISTLVTQIRERVKTVNEPNIQLKHVDNLPLPMVFRKKMNDIDLKFNRTYIS